MIGTPFKTDDEREQRKVNRMNKKPWEQEVRDEKGRKRFHGAFTGGFSAGYFNTVGSKEGWKPSTYSKGKNQSIMDYMDEEDINMEIGSQTITSKEEYVDTNNPLLQISQKEKRNMAIPGGEVLLETLVPQFNQIQEKLMQAAGFDDRKTTKKEEERNSNMESGKYFNGRLEFKDNYHGYGYVGAYDPSDNFKKSNANQKLISGELSRNVIKMDQFEEDNTTGYYNTHDISEYAFEEIEADEDDNNSGTKKLKSRNTPNTGTSTSNHPFFVKSKAKLQMATDITFEMPKLPKDYDPFKKLTSTENLPKESQDTHRNINLSFNPYKRAELLAETIEHPKKSHLLSRFQSADEIRKKRDIELPSQINDDNSNNNSNPNTNTTTFSHKHNNGPSPIDQIKNYFNFKLDIPFKDDIGKVSRFAKFVAEKEGLLIGENYYNVGNLMTACQVREEKIIFDKLYQDEQNLKKSEEALRTEIRKNKKESEIQESKPSVKEMQFPKREKIKWRPDKLLCKRFKVKDPYENIVEKKEDLAEGYSDLQMKIIKENEHRTSKNPNANIRSINNESNMETIINAKPDINLFEEIFGD